MHEATNRERERERERERKKGSNFAAVSIIHDTGRESNFA